MSTLPQTPARPEGESDPLGMCLLLRRGAFDALAPAGELAGAAAVACVRAHAGEPSLEA
jgi:hypothetical protein